MSTRWRAALAASLLALQAATATHTAAAPPGDGLSAPGTLVEPHHRLQERERVALTLDACGGRFDARLIEGLIAKRVPATLFVTRRWLDANPAALRLLLAHPGLFELQNHGAAHRALWLGPQVQRFGLAGQPSLAALREEVSGGAARIQAAGAPAPLYFRGAGAAYDAAGLQAVHELGQRVAGFSVNADGGARLPAAQVAQRLLAVRGGDVVLAHMNHPEGGTAEGFAHALPELQRRGLQFVKLSKATLVPLP